MRKGTKAATLANSCFISCSHVAATASLFLISPFSPSFANAARHPHVYTTYSYEYFHRLPKIGCTRQASFFIVLFSLYPSG